MAQPTFISQPLTRVANKWKNENDALIGNIIFPTVPVAKKEFKVPYYGKESLIIPSDVSRTGESKYKRVRHSRGYNTPTILTEKGLSDFVTKDDKEQTGDEFDALSDAVENIQERMELVNEKNLATMLSDTAIVTQNQTLSGPSQWSDTANSDPINDIKTAIQAIRGSALVMPNSMWFDMSVWLTLMDHPAVVDRVRGAVVQEINVAMMKRLLAPYGIQNIYIAKATENTGGEGASDSLSSVWGKHAWLGYITNNPGYKQVNGGYKFALRNGRVVTREEKANPPGTEVVNADYYEHILLSDTCYYLFKNAIA